MLMVLLSELTSCEYVYESDDDNAHGVHISGNDQFAVYSGNSYVRTTMIFALFTSGVSYTTLFQDNDLYVYSSAVVFNNDNSNSNELYTFVQIAENIKALGVFFSLITVNKSLCGRYSWNIHSHLITLALIHFANFSSRRCQFSGHKCDRPSYTHLIRNRSTVHVTQSRFRWKL
jgi:hypothetical protein